MILRKFGAISSVSERAQQIDAALRLDTAVAGAASGGIAARISPLAVVRLPTKWEWNVSGGAGVTYSASWRWKATPMKWTIRIELTPDGNPPITYDIGTITRPIADLSPEQIGLTLEEGQQLLRRVQVGPDDQQPGARLCAVPTTLRRLWPT
jgi:hypothetical protein